MRKSMWIIGGLVMLCLSACGQTADKTPPEPALKSSVSVSPTAMLTPSATPTPTPSPIPTIHVIKEEWQLNSADANEQSLRLEYVYDEYGRRTQKQDFLSDTYDGTSYEYLPDGRVNWYRYGQGEIMEKGAWVFDQNGNATQVITITGEGEQETETVIYRDFDLAGNLSRSFSNYINEYDDAGRLVKTTQKRGETEEGFTQYTYDEEGHLIQKDVFDEKGEAVTTATYYADGLPKGYVNYTVTEACTIQYVVTNGTLTGFIRYDQVHDKSSSYLVTYYENGDVEVVKEYDAKGQFITGTRYVYADIPYNEAELHNQNLNYPYYYNLSLPYCFWDEWQ